MNTPMNCHPKSNCEQFRFPCRHPHVCVAFTLIELLVVLAVVAMLGALLLPAMAVAKGENWRAQCQNQMKQLGVGFSLFVQDHNEMFPPAAYQVNGGTFSWDTYIHRYIGGTASDSDLIIGALDVSRSPKILRCPTDIQPKVFWMAGFGVRSYSMVGVGPVFGVQYQVPTSGQKYPLPNIDLGVGIYWSDSAPSVPDWNAKSYKTSVIRDPAGTILLVEQPNGQGGANNAWPSISVGPSGTGSLYQIDPAAAPQNPSGSQGVNQGAYTYRLHEGRFNYLFHDGHVAALSTNQTIGTGTLSAPKGMWTVTAGD